MSEYEDLENSVDEKFQLRQDNLQLRQENNQLRQELRGTEQRLEGSERDLEAMRKKFLWLCGAVVLLVAAVLAVNAWMFPQLRHNQTAPGATETTATSYLWETTAAEPAAFSGTAVSVAPTAAAVTTATSSKATTTAGTTTSTARPAVSARPNIGVVFVNANGSEFPMKTYDAYPPSDAPATHIGTNVFRIKLTGPDAQAVGIRLMFPNNVWGAEEKKPAEKYTLSGTLVFAFYLNQNDRDSIVYVKAAP